MALTDHTSFFAHGKLLLTAEYLVLDGATALAVPTRKGQWMDVRIAAKTTHRLQWTSRDIRGNDWFRSAFSLPELNVLETTDTAISQRLEQLLWAMTEQNPDVWTRTPGWEIATRLEFPREWGFGTSSTLVYNLASWSGLDAFRLLSATFGGSGYDLACAASKGPILYRLLDNQAGWETVRYHPPFKDQLYLVYLGQKMNSRKGIARYRHKARTTAGDISDASSLTSAFMHATELKELERVMTTHEQLVSHLTGIDPVGEQLFSWWEGTVKSLGAWGGDFVLVTDPTADDAHFRSVFRSKGFETILGFADALLLSPE